MRFKEIAPPLIREDGHCWLGRACQEHNIPNGGVSKETFFVWGWADRSQNQQATGGRTHIEVRT